ncbi:DNA-binding transcriptional activator DecR [Methylobacterium crusticola]|uniref:DNA-binding transcriptional activator DecR n=1 Tax=Methylobacterium crusticola TaxID=1697972 RepID=A0ABQ4QPV6_9HYPH|nr:Lrp/AsnC family transcriptional regulator [Methylobacterium crusticola]GJD47323.1 DNA-binding transcriptional activator DecR [Methylobacterium crusticola]
MPQGGETLDRFERAILDALQDDARLSVQDLSQRIGLSTSPTWRRLKALEERGVIRGYVALADPAALGFGQCVFAHVTLIKHDRDGVADFERSISRRPEVLECFSTTGQADYLLRVVVRDAQHYERFLQEAVFSCPAVQQIHSNFALREVKFSVKVPALP